MNILVKVNDLHIIAYLKTDCGATIKASIAKNGKELNEIIMEFCQELGTHKITFENNKEENNKR